MLACAGAAAVRGAPPPRSEIKSLKVTDTSGELYIRGNIRSKEETTAGGSSLEESDSFFQEGIALRAKGYIYHPNLIDFDVSVQGGLSQQEIEINSDSRKSNGTLSGFNLSALVLKKKRIGGRVFASRTTNFIDRDFAATQEVEIDKFGFELIRRGRMPIRLLVEQFGIRETGDLRENEQTTRHMRLSLTDQRDPDLWWEIIYDREDTDETVTTTSAAGGGSSSELPVQSDELTFASLLRWGDQSHPSRLALNGRFLDRKGFFVNRVQSADANLTLGHTPTFSTFYRGAYSIDETETEEDRLLDTEAGFRKQFYESLNIAGRVSYRDRQFIDGFDKVLGWFFDAAYIKLTPIGRYNAALLLGHEREQEDSGTGTRTIRDEQVTLSGTTYVALDERSVIDGSISVTNLDRDEVFTEGDDFELRETGSLTEIRRIIGGDILDGETVLVTYRVLAARNAEFTTNRIRTSHRLTLRKIPLAIYYHYSLRDEQLTGGNDPGNLDTQTQHLFGLELNWRDLQVTYEHDVRDQMLSPPSTSDRLDVRWQRRLTRRTDLAVGGGAERLVYDSGEQFNLGPGEDQLDTVRGYARVTTKLKRNILLRLSADYLKTEGRENDELLEFVGSLDWRFRDLEVSVEARQSFYTQETTEGSEQQLMFLIRRRF